MMYRFLINVIWCFIWKHSWKINHSFTQQACLSTLLNKFHIFKLNGIKALSYNTFLKKTKDNPAQETQVSAWAQTFSFTFLLDYVDTKWR